MRPAMTHSRMNSTRALIAVLVLALQATAVPLGEQEESPMGQQLQQANNDMARFDASQSLDDLDRALRELLAIRLPSQKSGLREEREQVIDAWVGLFRRIDKTYDPNFNPNDRVPTRIAPPGGGYPAGVDPKSIPY